MTKHKGSSHTPPRRSPCGPPVLKRGGRGFTDGGWRGRVFETYQAGPSAPEPLSMPRLPPPPAAHCSELHTRYVLSTKGDRLCTSSSRTRPELPTPTFQPERPRAPPPQKRWVKPEGCSRARQPLLPSSRGRGVPPLSSACLPRCLWPPLVPPLCVFVGGGTCCPLGPGRGSGSLRVPGNRVVPRFRAAVYVFASESPSPWVPVPCLHGPAPPATWGLPSL